MNPSRIIFLAMCHGAGISAPVPEYKFHKSRKWRFDYAWPAHKVALEVEGGVWTQGRHTRGSGFVNDMEKYNAAAALGWRVFRCTPSDLCRVATVDMVAGAANTVVRDGPAAGRSL